MKTATKGKLPRTKKASIKKKPVKKGLPRKAGRGPTRNAGAKKAR
jgi:hypothetical protein